MVAVNTALVGGSMLFRQGLRQLLNPNQFVIVAEQRDFAGAATFFGATGPRPTLVIANLDGPHDRDLEGLTQLRAVAGGDCRIVVLASALQVTEMVRTLKAGADGYLLNDLSVDVLSLSLLLVMKGEKVLPGSLADIVAMTPQEVAANQPIAPRQNLSDRETQILRCLVNGDSNKLIARALGITDGTVKVHLKSLMKKIAASNRTQAALWAHDNGLGSEFAAAASVMSPITQRSMPGRITA